MRMRSMTGYGAGSRAHPHGQCVVEARSINSKSLEVRLRLPDALAARGAALEARVRKQLRRGRIDIGVRLEGQSQGPLTLDAPRAKQALRDLERLRQEVGIAAGDASGALSVLAALPGLFVADEAAIGDLQATAELALDEALAALIVDRGREAQLLHQELQERSGRVSVALHSLELLLRDQPAKRRQRLQDRLADHAAQLDPARLTAEVLLLCERHDASEELSRLRAHVDHLSTLLGAEAPQGAELGIAELGTAELGTAELGTAELGTAELEAPRCEGKRLDFLLQEMHREANTLAVKAEDAAVSHLIVEVKLEIDRMREQAQNVE